MLKSRPKRSREKYSRLICLGCRERRIRCELPDEVEIPNPGELRPIETPCYRCKRLGQPCVVRQTILGRPAGGIRPASTGNVVSRVVIEFPVPAETEQTASSRRDTLLVHRPQSPTHILTIRALDTLHRENVSNEWFRHLPSRAGHSSALDLSIKALVAACAFARGVPRLSSNDCYQALSLALEAIIIAKEPNDNILASTALLAPFDGVIRKNGIPTRTHIDGLAAILRARSATYPVSDIAREILDFNVVEAGIMACIQDTVSPFENVPREYFSKADGSDQDQLKGLGKELFISIPRLVRLVRQQTAPIMDVSKSVSKLQDRQAEERLLQKIKLQSSNTPPYQSLQFACVEDFEALAYYWQGRLSLLRLEYRLLRADLVRGPERRNDEIFRLTQNILTCSEYAKTLPLRKQVRICTHAMVVVWGVLKDMPRVDPSPLTDLLLRRVNTALEAKPDLTAEDMDAAADSFVGGVPEGRFVELFGL